MSNLKYLSAAELIQARADCLRLQRYAARRIAHYNGVIGGANTRIDWINKYLAEKERTQGKTTPLGL